MEILFQSPSLRGSGRFLFVAARATARARGFNPLHCGAVVASRRPKSARRARRRVSIPFIAGQWSLRYGALGAAVDAALVSIPFIAGQWSLPTHLPPPSRGWGAFQSPSLRGSGRFPALHGVKLALAWFQSPSLRGSGRFSYTHRHTPRMPYCFNPLHCGAVVASCRWVYDIR